MNRADLAWALSAVLPHAGKTEATASIGLATRDGWLHVYATDKYTVAVARVEEPGNVDAHLLPKDATELMRWLRPTRVAEQEEPVQLVQSGSELHVGLGDCSDDDSTGVYDLIEHSVSLDWALDFGRTLMRGEPDASPVFGPNLLAKFAKAQRNDFDTLRLRMVRKPGSVVGAGIVTVGSDFLGLVAGIRQDDDNSLTIIDSFIGDTRDEAAA